MSNFGKGAWARSAAGPWLAALLLISWTTAVHCALNLTAAAAQARLLRKETESQGANGGSFFYTNVGPNSFEYRGMFSPGQTPVDFHKNFQQLFDKFPDFPEFDFPKVVHQPNPTAAPISNQQNPQEPYVPHYDLPATAPPRRLTAATRAPQIIPQYELYRIRTTTAPRLKPIQPVGRQLVNPVPVQPFERQYPVQPIVNHIPVQPQVDHIPVQPLLNPFTPALNHIPVQPLVNQVQPLYRFSVTSHTPDTPPNPGQPLLNQVQPLINQFQPFVNPVLQPVQPKYHVSVPTIAPRIAHDDQPYSNPEQQPFQFPVDFPEYHLVRGQTRAESYPKIFRFTDGRINIVDFERKKKKNPDKKVLYSDGLDPDQVSRDQFLILHGGYYPTDKYSNNDAKYDNRVLYDNVNEVQDLRKLAPNLPYFYQK